MTLASSCDTRTAVVLFGVPEHGVDRLIECALDTAATPQDAAPDESGADRAGPHAADPVRWFVFGLDMTLLATLDRCWHGTATLVVTRLLAFDAANREAVRVILEREGQPLESVIWVHGPLARCGAPDPVREVLRVPGDSEISLEAIAAQLRQSLRPTSRSTA